VQTMQQSYWSTTGMAGRIKTKKDLAELPRLRA
jgi:hypothetical protein